MIRVQLSDVDYESVVENARGEDNEGRRRELIKDLVREALGVSARDPDVFGVYEHPVIWRGSRRSVDLVFGNVRDAGWLTEDHFRARPGTWRVVVDYPFDDPGHSSAEDLSRVDRLIEGGLKSRTIAWLPWFLSEDRMRDVRRLVILDWLLGGSGERWTMNADHLSEVDRAQARAILESQRTGLREALRRAVQECYGAAAPSPGTLADDATQDRVLVSLDPGFSPARPVGADLAAAFGNLVDQAFTATYPGHPRFEPGDVEITVRDLAAVYAHVERAVADQDRRVPLEGDIPAVRRVANALQVGMAGETHFLFGDDRFVPWGAEFERAAARDGVRPQDPVTVGQVRAWIDAIRPELGLRDDVADLIVLAWAALRQRAWYQHGAPIPAPRPGAARPDMQLKPEPLPTPADWQAATSRAEEVFGIRANPYLTAAARRRVRREPQGTPGHRGRSRRGPGAPRGTGLPAPRPARRRPRPAGDRARRSHAGRVVAPGQQRRASGGDPGPGRAARHEHGGGELAEPGSGRHLGGRRVPVGPARTVACRGEAGRRSRPGRGEHAEVVARRRGGGRVHDQAGTGSLGHRRRDLRVAVGWPAGPPGAAAGSCAPTTSTSTSGRRCRAHPGGPPGPRAPPRRMC